MAIISMIKNLEIVTFAIPKNARVVELVDTLSSGGSAERCGGSNPLARTKTRCWNVFSTTGFLFSVTKQEIPYF